MTKRLKIVDFLRGFSIFTIALMHLVQSYDLPSVLDKAATFGGAGVHVFILCSGFGLYLSYLYKPLSYGDFLKRRFTKIYLPYIIVIFLSAFWGLYNSGAFDWQAVLSHVFLYKMFSPAYESSLGGQMWFVSTIIQFYIFWPTMVWIAKKKQSLIYGLLISLGWATLVGMLGFEGERVWNSFFLQYVWEFVLGMWLANHYYRYPDRWITPRWGYVCGGIIIGMTLTGFMAWNGGILKLYNDIPSLLGYLSLLLFVYKLGMPIVNRFFCYTNRISYEWYLVHILVFAVVKTSLDGAIPVSMEIILCIVSSYIIAWIYDKALRLCAIK